MDDLSRYKVVYISKGHGKKRKLHVPDDALKLQQRMWLANEMRTGIGPGPYAHGFVIGRSPATHARLHVGKKYVCRIDIKDFFPSVRPDHLTQLYRMEKLMPVEIELKRGTLYHLAFLRENPSQQSFLPQGSPLSPYLANLAMKKIDFKIAKWVRNYFGDGRYSRYADDIIISSDSRGILIAKKVVRRILADHGFMINERKWRVMRASGSQRVCGIVVNKKINIPKDERRLYRARVHNVWKKAKVGEPVEAKEIAHVRGWLSYAYSVSPEYARKELTKLKWAEEFLAHMGCSSPEPAKAVEGVCDWDAQLGLK